MTKIRARRVTGLSIRMTKIAGSGGAGRHLTSIRGWPQWGWHCLQVQQCGVGARARDSGVDLGTARAAASTRGGGRVIRMW
jgi:hypothetical protein